MTTPENPDERLCGRVDGAQVCAAECWRAAMFGDRPCPPPTPSRPTGDRRAPGGAR